MSNQIAETGCCPRFDPTLWDNKTFRWRNKKFVKDTVFTFFYMPLNFGSVITRLMNAITKSGANTPKSMCLSDHTSKWKMDINVDVDKKVSGAKNITLSGKFFFKVYEGNFKDTGIWMQNFQEILDKKGVKAKKIYMWYTTCPKCAKVYSKNYVVAIAKI
jgi:hypothetical protein